MKTILGRKTEMTQVFDKTGKIVPVTLIDTRGCMVVGVKTEERDGYAGIKLGIGFKKSATRPEIGKYKGMKVPLFVREVKTTDVLDIGSLIHPDIFSVGDKVTVVGVSKGKGFAGVMKRWHFAGTGSRTHGQSTKPRHPGSIGAGTTPGRVFKGKKMAGRMGGDRVSVRNVEIIFVDQKEGLIGVKGMVPGAKNGFVTLSGKTK